MCLDVLEYLFFLYNEVMPQCHTLSQGRERLQRAKSLKWRKAIGRNFRQEVRPILPIPPSFPTRLALNPVLLQVRKAFKQVLWLQSQTTAILVGTIGIKKPQYFLFPAQTFIIFVLMDLTNTPKALGLMEHIKSSPITI